MKYRIFISDEPAGATDWLPIAQAAWNRATRDRDAAQHGGEAVLLIDGRVVAAVQPRTLEGHAWPVGEDHITNLRDVARAVQQLARVAGVQASALADELTHQGLPTTTARLKSMETHQDGRRTHVSPAELVAMCYAAIGVIKKGSRA